MPKRWGKTPPWRLERFRQRLLNSEMSVVECARRSGIATSGATIQAIVNKTRRYLHDGTGRWISQLTGDLHPREFKTATEAAKLAGVSIKTLYRRLAKGEVRRKKAVHNRFRLSMSSRGIRRLSEIGHKKAGIPGVLSRQDVLEIRRLARTLPQSEIAKFYPVTRRHISRIINGDRWKDIA